jgi:two-component sensor histidine kinase
MDLSPDKPSLTALETIAGEQVTFPLTSTDSRPPPGAAMEAARLAAVRDYALLDTPADATLDHITALAAALLAAPVALISIVDEDRIWFKSHHGLAQQETAREPGLCATAILQKRPWMLPDTAADAQASRHSLVTGSPALRFYLGVPLRNRDGHCLGMLCVMDRKPRDATRRQVAGLVHLAAIAMAQIDQMAEARRSAAVLAEVAADREKALRLATMMATEIDHRVMNSLQLVSGLLSMQSRSHSEDDVATQLKQAANRVSAIARVHQHIYLSEGIEHVDVAQYLQRVCADLSEMLQSSGRGEIEVSGVGVKLPTARIVAIGLIINELVTNAIKYGQGQVAVRFSDTGSGFRLDVCDEGPGLTAAQPLAPGRGFGMKMVRLLVDQMKGELSHGPQDNGRGLRMSVNFPRDIIKPPSIDRN